MQTMYESEVYAENNPSWHEEDSPWKAGHIARIITDNAIPHRRVCEVGCGVGGILANLAIQLPGSDFTGYEISPYAYERATQRAGRQATFILGDVTTAQDTDFDVVLLIDVIEHIEDCFAFLKQLKPIGTYKVLHIPLDLSVQSVFRLSPIMRQRAGVGHIHYFLKDTALAMLEDCGYSIVDYRYTASRLELPNQASSSQLMRWPRRLLSALSPDFAARVVGGYSLLVLVK